MHIQSMTLTNFRGFERLQAAFLPGMNVITGRNGAGLTSLLVGVAAALQPMAQALQAGVAKPLAIHDVRQLWQGDKTKRWLAACFPCKCRCRLERNGGVVESGVVLRSEADRTASWCEMPAAFETPLPLLAFYRVNRSWSAASAISAVEAVEEPEARRDGYVDWDEAGRSDWAVKRWLVTKSIERLQKAVERQIDFWAVADDELADVNRALQRALPGRFERIHYDMTSRHVLVQIDGETKVFTWLSEGLRVFIGLLADIARRLCLLRPELGDQVMAEADGIVLIDELELHLDPEWQRRMVQGLTAAFPKLQFIVTTHSPQVLSGVEAGRVLLLKDGRMERPDLFPVASSDETGCPIRRTAQTSQGEKQDDLA